MLIQEGRERKQQAISQFQARICSGPSVVPTSTLLNRGQLKAERERPAALNIKNEKQDIADVLSALATEQRTVLPVCLS